MGIARLTNFKLTLQTYIGSVLLAVNPNTPLPIYSTEQIRLYRSRRIGELPPHIFATANSAYCNMKLTNRDQCIFIRLVQAQSSFCSYFDPNFKFKEIEEIAIQICLPVL